MINRKCRAIFAGLLAALACAAGAQGTYQPGPAERQLLEQARERAAALDRATEEVANAYRELRAAEERREKGVEPLEGERAGHLLRPEYQERQKALEQDVETARKRYDDALARRNALRY